MRIYTLTSVGRSMASNPMHNPSVAQSVIYWLKRHGGTASDEQIKNFALPQGVDYRTVINSLIRAKAISPVG